DQIRQLQVVDEEPDIMTRSSFATYGDYPRLLSAARRTLRLWRLSIVLFLIFTAADLGAANSQTLINALSHYAPLDIGNFWLNLLRRSAALSVALMGTAYYLKIYSMLTARGLPGSVAQEAE